MDLARPASGELILQTAWDGVVSIPTGTNPMKTL
jgi:hypothetical protein